MEELDPASFTPWFKLIVNKFLFPWWDVLSSKRTHKPVSATAASAAQTDQQGVLDAKSLAGLKDHVIHRML